MFYNMFTKVKRFLYNAYIYSSKAEVMTKFEIPNLENFTDALEPIENSKSGKRKASESSENSAPKKKIAVGKTTVNPEDVDVKDVESGNEVSSAEASENSHASTETVDAFIHTDQVQDLDPAEVVGRFSENVLEELSTKIPSQEFKTVR